jgi:hypothetical protein
MIGVVGWLLCCCKRRRKSWEEGGEGPLLTTGRGGSARLDSGRLAVEQRGSRLSRQKDGRRSHGLRTASLDPMHDSLELHDMGQQPSRRHSQLTGNLSREAGVDAAGLQSPADIEAANLLARLERMARASIEEDVQPMSPPPGDLSGGAPGDPPGEPLGHPPGCPKASGASSAAENSEDLLLSKGDVVYYRHRDHGWILVKVLRVDFEGAADGGLTYVVGGTPQLKGAEIETTRARLFYTLPWP